MDEEYSFFVVCVSKLGEKKDGVIYCLVSVRIYNLEVFCGVFV